MNLSSRIRISLGVAAVVPVLLLGWRAVAGAREELVETVGGALGRQATELARGFERLTLDRLGGLRQTASYIPFERLSRDEASAALAIPYRQSPDLNVLAVLDGEGRPVTRIVADRDPGGDPALRGHEPVDDRGVEAFRRGVPLEAALGAGLGVGAPYLAPGSGIPRLVLAVRLPASGPRVLAAELSLAELREPLQEAAADGVAFLVSEEGALLAGTRPGPLGPDEAAFVSESWVAAGQHVRVVQRGGQPWLAAFAPVGVLGWGVVLAQPTSLAFRAVDRVQRQTAVWAIGALLLAGVLGHLLTRALARPVRALTDAAVALRDGRFDAPLPRGGSDELGTLAGTFAHMASEVRRRDAEIRGWNAELQARVDARTAELRAAEEQIFRSRRLAAVGSLSAGVANGLNDPLTSVIGLVTLARASAGPGTEAGELLGTALGEARRVTAVVKDLRRLAAPGLAEGARRFGLDRPVTAAVERLQEAAAARGVALEVDVDPALPVMEGDPEQIDSLVTRLVENGLAATAPGGRVSVSASAVDGAALRLVVADEGPGIPPGMSDRIFDPFFSAGQDGAGGLGLSLAHGIVAAHHGRIQAESAPGRGATFTVHFPAAPRRSHTA